MWKSAFFLSKKRVLTHGHNCMYQPAQSDDIFLKVGTPIKGTLWYLDYYLNFRPIKSLFFLNFITTSRNSNHFISGKGGRKQIQLRHFTPKVYSIAREIFRHWSNFNIVNCWFFKGGVFIKSKSTISFDSTIVLCKLTLLDTFERKFLNTIIL